MNNDLIINKFIEELIDTLKNKNVVTECYLGTSIDIPYVLAPIEQNLSSKKYKEFVNSIKTYDYGINYLEDKTGGYTNGRITVKLFDKIIENRIAYSYEIEFTYENRYNEDCTCTKKDDGYREDKHCCGRKCDWIAPSFTINKIEHVGSDSFSGLQHEYWNYEDDFYKHDQELLNEKATKEREERITYLKDNIRKMQLELLTLNWIRSCNHTLERMWFYGW